MAQFMQKYEGISKVYVNCLPSGRVDWFLGLARKRGKQPGTLSNSCPQLETAYFLRFLCCLASKAVVMSVKRVGWPLKFWSAGIGLKPIYCYGVCTKY